MTNNQIRTNFCSQCKEFTDRIEALEADNERLRRSAEGWEAEAKRYADNAEYWEARAALGGAQDG